MTGFYSMDNFTCNSTCGCVSDEEIMNAIRIGNILSLYVLPCIVLPGILLNCLSCLVFTCSDLKKLSSSVYIFALLVSDTGVLLGLFVVWLEAKGIQINHLNGVCQGMVFFPYMFSFLSVWYVVCVTVENYITICHPCRIKSMCTRRRATITCLCVFVASVFLYGATPFTAEVRSSDIDEYKVCTDKREFRKFMQVFTYIDSLLTLLVPLIAISCLLVGLVLSIFHASRWKKRMGGLPLVMRAPTPPPRYKKSQAPPVKDMSSDHGMSSSVPLTTTVQTNGSTYAPEHEQPQDPTPISYGCRYHHGNSRGHFGKSHKRDAVAAQRNSDASRCTPSAKRTTHRPKNAQVRVTRMLFALSVSYVVMNAPSHVTRLYFLIRTTNVLGGGCQLTYTEGLINLALQYVTYAHSAGKFWIFLLFSKNFTKSLTVLLKDSFLCKRPCSKIFKQ